MIPEVFLERMKNLLGDDFPAFFDALNKGEPVRGLRLNSRLLERETFEELFPFPLVPLTYAENGYIVEGEKIGKHPWHHAGAFYLQDPGAMATATCLSLREGMRVCDLCASPGGKSTQISPLIGDSGFLLANEINPARCKTLTANVERMGCRNTLVTMADTSLLSQWYPSYFDVVVVDAPCSGEGMFRKYDFAGDEWSPAEVLSCAALQKEILCNASAMVKIGGYLLYSTCTFSLEENERQIDCFLTQHPEFDTVDVPLTLRCSTAGGMTEDTCLHPLSIARTRRFYPHISPGEGQYICLMQKKGGGFEDNPCFTPLREKWQKGEKDCAETFLRDNLEELSGFTLHKYGEVITLLPEKVWVPPHSVYAAGIQVGSVQKGRIEPHHQFFSAFGNFMKRKINLCLSDTRLKAYLRGEQIETNEEDGYGAVLAEGVPLGGVKIVSGVAKNRYPKGLRQNE